MKKLILLITITGSLLSCNNKKTADKAAGNDTTGTTMENKTDEKKETATQTNGVPNFSDPEVQKFANDYYAFLQEYKTALKDPSKATEMANNMTEWSTRAGEISLKLASNPEDAKKWADWSMVVSQEFADATKELYEHK